MCLEPLYELDDPHDVEFLRDLYGQERSARWARASLFALPFALLASWGCLAVGLDEVVADVLAFAVCGSMAAIAELLLRLELPRTQRAIMREVSALRPGRMLVSVPMVLVTLIVLSQYIATEVLSSPGSSLNSFMTLGANAPAARWACVPNDIMQGQNLPTLVTSAFVHADLAHLVANAFGLFLFGMALDLRLGRARTATLIIAGVTLGSLTHVAGHTASQVPLVGISGGVYALVAAQLVVMPTRPQFIVVHGAVFEAPNWLVLSILALAMTSLDYALHPDIAWQAHVGGFVAGVILGALFRGAPEPDAYIESEELRLMRGLSGI